MASAASRVIFGESEPQDKDKKPKESGTEPVSGVTGAGTAEEPYDAGNEEDTNQAGTATSTTQPDLSQRRDEDDQGKPDIKPKEESTSGTSDPTLSSTAPSGPTGEDENTATTSSDSQKKGDDTEAAGYSTYLAHKLDAKDDSQREAPTALGDKPSASQSDTTNLVNPAGTESSKPDIREDSQHDQSTSMEDKPSTSQSDTTNLVKPAEIESKKLDAPDDSQRDEPTTLGEQTSTLPSDTTNLAPSAGTESSKPETQDVSRSAESTNLRDESSGLPSDTTNLLSAAENESRKPDAQDDSKPAESTTLGDQSSTLDSDMANLAISSDDRKDDQPKPSTETQSTAGIPGAPVDPQNAEASILGGGSSTLPSDSANLADPVDTQMTDSQAAPTSALPGSTSVAEDQGARVDPPGVEATTLGAVSSLIPSDTANLADPAGTQRSYGQPDPSTESYGSTSIAEDLGPRVDPQGDQSMNLGEKSSTLPSDPADTQSGQGQADPSTTTYGSTYIPVVAPVQSQVDTSTTLGDPAFTLPSDTTNVAVPSDTQPGYGLSEPITGSDTTTMQSSTLQGTDDYHGSSSIGGDTSDRLPGQTDTSFAPSGGVAEGGFPQGRNTIGDVRPEHQTDKTGVTGIHSDDPKLTVEYPSSSNEPSAAPGGQSRAPAGGFGLAEPSVGADPSSGQKPMQKEQGADRPLERPSEDNQQAIREEKETTERALGERDRSGHSMEGAPHSVAEKGTGEQWVKSTGTVADGGDFDAAAPGAGKEADRLLGQQGGQREADPSVAEPTEKHEKPKLGEKIKEKLHIGHHHH